MMLRPRLLLPPVLALLLAACAGGQQLQKAGDANAFDMQLVSTLDWSRIKRPRFEAWTIDGTDLNLLRIYSGVRANEHVFQTVRQKNSRPDGPWFKPAMRPDEIRDVVLDALREEGAANVAGGDLRPHRFGGTDGLRFDFTMTSANGLDYRGTAAAAVRNGTLTLLLWYAPAEYYYDRDVAAVSRMLDDMTFVQ